jgi:hypothetical protein
MSQVHSPRIVEKCGWRYSVEISQVGGRLDCIMASPLSTCCTPMLRHILIAMLTGWINRHRQQVMASPLQRNRILTVQLGGHRLPLADTERCRLTAWPHPLCCTPRPDVTSIVRPDILMRCLTASRPDVSPGLSPQTYRQTAAYAWVQCAGEPARPPGAFSHWRS